MGLTKVSTDGVKDDAITSGKIPANAVGASELADNAVDTNAIANDAVNFNKIDHIDSGRLLGRVSSGLGQIETPNASQVRTLLNVADGANQTTINNNADNRVITGSGTANTLNGEANLTFDGSNLGINGDLVGLNNTTLFSSNGGSGVRAGIALSGSDQTLKFYTVTGGSERMRIDSTGDIGLGTTTPNLSNFASPVTSIGKSGNPYSFLEMQGNQTSDGAFAVIAGYNSGGSARTAQMVFERKSANNSGSIVFETASSGNLATRVRISNDGLLFGSDTAAANALDDYEEGTFDAINNYNTVWYSNENKCSYTKIGRQVTVMGQIRVYSGSGDVKLGLPFNTANGLEGEFKGAGALNTYAYDWPTGTSIGVLIEQNTAYVYPAVTNQDNSAWNVFQHDAGAYLRFTFTYFTS